MVRSIHFCHPWSPRGLGAKPFAREPPPDLAPPSQVVQLVLLFLAEFGERAFAELVAKDRRESHFNARSGVLTVSVVALAVEHAQLAVALAFRGGVSVSAGPTGVGVAQGVHPLVLYVATHLSIQSCPDALAFGLSDLVLLLAVFLAQFVSLLAVF